MAIIVRLDIDRPYGKKSIFHQLISRISSDLYFPKIDFLGYLEDLNIILKIFNNKKIVSYVFFRKCTFPSQKILKVLDKGSHIIGLHLENSKSYDSFRNELQYMERRLGRKITSFSKHGSGLKKYGFHHYPKYEPEKYIEWAQKCGLKNFFGNNENPEIKNEKYSNLNVFPAAFWLEPPWRDTNKYDFEWLKSESHNRDITLLIHPDNITSDNSLFNLLLQIIDNIPTQLYE